MKSTPPTDLAVRIAEELRPIIGWPYYLARSDGKILSTHYRVSGAMFVRPSPLVMCATKINTGYTRVTLTGKSGRLNAFVHRLVLTAFVGPAPKGTQCGHLNGVRDDNRLCNLAWITPKENQRHRILHGTDGFGEKNSGAKLTDRQAFEIRVLLSGGVEGRDLSRKYGVSSGIIYKIKHGHTYSNSYRAARAGRTG